VITEQLLREWNACYSDEKLKVAFDKRAEITPREVATDKTITADDRMWVLAKCLCYLDERAARLFAIETAMSVCHLAGDDDDQAVFAGLLNELIIIEELPDASWDVAWYATRAATRDAARDAAWAAAWSATRDATRDATYDAAWSATRDAAWAVACGAARVVTRVVAWDAAWDAAWAATYDAAQDATRRVARDAALEKTIDRAIEWLGDYADGWEG
jgi:hypothetical protein